MDVFNKSLACEWPLPTHDVSFFLFRIRTNGLMGHCIKKPSCTVCHACRGTEARSSLPHSSTLIKQLPPQSGCSRESTTLVWTGLFLAGMDCERALVLFQSYWLCLKHHNYLVPFECAESFSSSVHPPHGWTKGDRIYEGSLQLTDIFSLVFVRSHVTSELMMCSF